MKVTILKEAGVEEALLGLSLSYNQPIEKMKAVADKLAHKDPSESKFLRFITVWLDITAPRYWLIEMDTYKVGKEQLSESTMHTLMRGIRRSEDYVPETSILSIGVVNDAIWAGDFARAKANLPEGFLQRRIVCTNYQTLGRIISQRKNHKLSEWREFIRAILTQVEHPEWLPKYPGGEG